MFKGEKNKLANIVNINKDAVEFYDAAEDQAERADIKLVKRSA